MRFKRHLISAIALAGLGPAGAAADALEGKPTVAEIIENTTGDDWRTLDQENLLYIELERGRVIVALSSTLAQNHVRQIRTLVREGFYDGLSFYRVIDGFVAQGGDVLEKRRVKEAEEALKAEFEEPYSDAVSFAALGSADGYAAQVGFVDDMPAGVDAPAQSVWLLHCAGAMAMARDIAKDTADTEFYITLQPQRYLDRNLSVFGRVVEGMEHLQALRRVQPAQSEGDDLGETILSMRIGSDIAPERQRKLQVLRTDTQRFDQFVEARRNRPAAFFYYRPDYVDICQLPLPVREEPVEANPEGQ